MRKPFGLAFPPQLACLKGIYQIQQYRHFRMKRIFGLTLLISTTTLTVHGQSDSPYATAADFAKYARQLREKALLKVEPQVFVPTSSLPTAQRLHWKTNI